MPRAILTGPERPSNKPSISNSTIEQDGVVYNAGASGSVTGSAIVKNRGQVGQSVGVLLSKAAGGGAGVKVNGSYIAGNGTYGLYNGDGASHDNYPDKIIIFRDTLRRDFGHDPNLLRHQVMITVRHELAHHIGFDELGVRDLGL